MTLLPPRYLHSQPGLQQDWLAMLEELNVFVDAHPTLEDEDQQLVNPSMTGGSNMRRTRVKAAAVPWRGPAAGMNAANRPNLVW